MEDNKYNYPIFDTIRKEYVLDVDNDCLVEKGQIDVVELVQSSKNTALNEVLDKYLDKDGQPLNNFQSTDSAFGQVGEQVLDDIDVKQDYYDTLDKFKEQTNSTEINYEKLAKAFIQSVQSSEVNFKTDQNNNSLNKEIVNNEDKTKIDEKSE